jgi:hypothetical protein
MNVASIRSRAQPAALLTLALTVCAAVTASPASATSYFKDLDAYIIQVRKLSNAGSLTAEQEGTLIKSARDDYADKQGLAFVPAIGQVVLAGNFPIGYGDIGSLGTLTFLFLNPLTDLPTTGPLVDHVVYEANLDPTNDLYTTIGVGTSAQSLFKLTWTITGFEPQIRATPYDAAGNQIILPGLDGFDVAQGVAVYMPVPSPSAGVLFAAGMYLVACGRRRRE